jgi:transcriptional regulator with XRE-family HTH domain
MKLEDYLTANALSAADFAERLGVHRGTVSRWIAQPKPGKPRFRPSWEELTKISAATFGAVTANDFVDDAAESNGEAAADPSPAAVDQVQRVAVPPRVA